jgi:hypothetical protein
MIYHSPHYCTRQEAIKLVINFKPSRAMIARFSRLTLKRSVFPHLVFTIGELAREDHDKSQALSKRLA